MSRALLVQSSGYTDAHYDMLHTFWIAIEHELW